MVVPAGTSGTCSPRRPRGARRQRLREPTITLLVSTMLLLVSTTILLVPAGTGSIEVLTNSNIVLTRGIKVLTNSIMVLTDNVRIETCTPKGYVFPQASERRRATKAASSEMERRSGTPHRSRVVPCQVGKARSFIR